ncbi:hypothetical protein C8A05DRAFT_19392, partial [Staphylotrichum tortipilum]
HRASSSQIAARAERFRKKLLNLAKEMGANGAEKCIVVLTHGVFMKFLAENKGIDLPKAGWKAYMVEEKGDGAVLKPLGETLGMGGWGAEVSLIPYLIPEPRDQRLPQGMI